MAHRSALICGAGIAGCTLAYWLVRAGWDVTVVEKAAGVRSSGNPVDVRGEAASIAQAMGVWPDLARCATGVDRLVFVDASGRRRAAIDTRRYSSDRKEVEVARADLAAVLLSVAGREADILFQDTITALHQDAGGVEVAFIVAPPRRFDLVFGADGLHSTVRRLAFGAEGRFSRPFGMFVGTVRTGTDTGDPHEVLMLNEPGRSLAIHPAGGKPIAAFMFRGRQRHDPHDPVDGQRLIERAYADAGWVTQQVLAEWQASDDVYFDTVTRIVMPSWTKGRVTLLGDAASCLSLFGEGSSNAMVAAATVAEALASHSDDHVAALAAYEATHRQHLRRPHRGARLASHVLVPASGAGIAVRNTAINLASYASRRGGRP